MDLDALRKKLIATREALPDRLERAVALQASLRAWLISRKEKRIGAYWPIKGEFDTLPALYRWSEVSGERMLGLPVINRETKQLRFHAWFPGCPMEEDAFHIPKPKDTPAFDPALLLVPCVGFGPDGVRLGYGGGYYDRSLPAMAPRPTAAGVAFAAAFAPDLDFETVRLRSLWSLRP